MAPDRRGVVPVNRRPEGLAIWPPTDLAVHFESGVRLAEQGYVKLDFSRISGEWSVGTEVR